VQAELIDGGQIAVLLLQDRIYQYGLFRVLATQQVSEGRALAIEQLLEDKPLEGGTGTLGCGI